MKSTLSVKKQELLIQQYLDLTNNYDNTVKDSIHQLQQSYEVWVEDASFEIVCPDQLKLRSQSMGKQNDTVHFSPTVPEQIDQEA